MGAEVLRTRLRLGGGSALCRCRATEVLALFAVGDVYVSHCKKALMLNLAHGEGREHYFGCNLVQRKVLDVPSIYSSASPWVGSQPCGAKYPGFCADSKGVYADDLWSISKGRVLAQDGMVTRSPVVHRTTRSIPMSRPSRPVNTLCSSQRQIPLSSNSGC